MRNVIVIAGVVALVACSSVDPYGALPPRPETSSSAAATEACSAGASTPMAGTDPAGLKECTGTKGTKGRCVPGSALGAFKGTFEAADCGGDAECLPEDLVKNGSSVELKKCNAVLDNEGRCFWPLAKDIVGNYDLLKGATKDQCPADMVCAPCTNPLTHEDTHVCSLGSGGSASCAAGATSGAAKPGAAGGGGTCPQIDPILDTSSFTAEDCGSGMLCVDASLVPPDEAKMLKSCAKGKCAPKKSVERGGNYVPKTCRSLGNSEGRCLNVAIPDVAAQLSLLPPSTVCDKDEACAPCFDPRTGADSGACHSAPCDAPKEPKKVFAKCCGGRGQCVPTSSAGSSADMLSKDSCSGDTPLCAPNELSGAVTPTKCTSAFGLLEGICVSKCTIDSVLAGFVQGSCPDTDMCAPCSFIDGGCK
jgi:hypothetical protein